MEQKQLFLHWRVNYLVSTLAPLRIGQRLVPGPGSHPRIHEGHEVTRGRRQVGRGVVASWESEEVRQAVELNASCAGDMPLGGEERRGSGIVFLRSGAALKELEWGPRLGGACREPA